MFPNIKAEMARNGMTKQSLAEYLGISSTTIRNWFNGKSEISSGALVKMVKMWNVSADYLLGLK